MDSGTEKALTWEAIVKSEKNACLWFDARDADERVEGGRLMGVCGAPPGNTRTPPTRTLDCGTAAAGGIASPLTTLPSHHRQALLDLSTAYSQHDDNRTLAWLVAPHLPPLSSRTSWRRLVTNGLLTPAGLLPRARLFTLRDPTSAPALSSSTPPCPPLGASRT
jgi:hypothetical protein